MSCHLVICLVQHWTADASKVSVLLNSKVFSLAQFDSNFIVVVKKIESFAFEVEDKTVPCDCAMQAIQANTWLAYLQVTVCEILSWSFLFYFATHLAITSLTHFLGPLFSFFFLRRPTWLDQPILSVYSTQLAHELDCKLNRGSVSLCSFG